MHYLLVPFAFDMHSNSFPGSLYYVVCMVCISNTIADIMWLHIFRPITYVLMVMGQFQQNLQRYIVSHFPKPGIAC